MSIDPNKFGISKSLIDAVNEALKGGQVKIDKNHNGKIDGQDFKMLRKEENIDEKSVSKAQQHAAGAALATQRGEYDGGKKGGAINRMASMKTSELRKFAGTKTKGLPTHKEEVEQVDELSKQTMGSYIKKASHDVATKSAATGRYADRANAVKDQMKKGDYSNYQQGKKDDAIADKMFNKSWKRRAGIAKATDKLTKEEVVDEALNPKKIAADHAAGHSVDLIVQKHLNKRGDNKDEILKVIRANAWNKRMDKKKVSEGIEQVDELSTDTYHKAAHKAAKRAMGDAQGRSGPIFKKYAGMANKFRDKGMSQEKKEKTMKEETLDEIQGTYGNGGNKKNLKIIHKGEVVKDYGTDTKPNKASRDKKAEKMKAYRAERDKNMEEANTMTKVKTTKDIGYKVVDVGPGQKEKIVKAHNWTEPKKKLPNGADYAAQRRKERLAANGRMDEETDPGFAEAAENPMTKQLADKKAAIQKTIVQKKMQIMQSKANKQMSSMKEGKCSCTEGKKSMTCETHGDKAMGMKGGKEAIQMNPPLRD